MVFEIFYGRYGTRLFSKIYSRIFWVWLELSRFFFCRFLQYMPRPSVWAAEAGPMCKCRFWSKVEKATLKVKVIQSHDVKERPDWNFRVWVMCFMFYVSSFSQEHEKNDLRILLKRSKSDKSSRFRNIQKSKEVASKVVIFDLQNIETGPSSRYLPDIFTHIHQTVLFLKYSFFENSNTFLDILKMKILIFPDFKISESKRSVTKLAILVFACATFSWRNVAKYFT